MHKFNLTSWLPLLATIIAGYFALIQIRINHVKTSRLAWLNNFKNLLAEFSSEVWIILAEHQSNIRSSEIDVDKISESQKEFLRKSSLTIFEHVKIAHNKHGLIKLNLNPFNYLHERLEVLLDAHMDIFVQIPGVETTQELNQLSQKLLQFDETIANLGRIICQIEFANIERNLLRRIWYKTFGQGRQLYLIARSLSNFENTNEADK